MLRGDHPEIPGGIKVGHGKTGFRREKVGNISGSKIDDFE